VNRWENISNLAEFSFRKVRPVKTVDTITLDIGKLGDPPLDVVWYNPDI